LASVSDEGDQFCVDVVIVTHNRCKLVLGCVKSVLSDGYENKNIIVIDDASVDGTAERLRAAFPNQIRVIVNARVQFLAASRNRGMTNTGARYLLCMDDDCVIPNGNVIQELARVLEKKRNVAAIAPAVHYTNGKMACCGARVFPVYRPMRPRLDKRLLLTCDYVPGTIGMYRREALEKVNGWDRIRFPFQAEDADLGLRLKEAGYEIVCAPWIKATHLKTGIVDIPNNERAYYAGMSRIMLYKSHLTKTAYTTWLMVANAPVIMFYVLFLMCHYRMRGTSLLRSYIRGLSAGLLLKAKPPRRSCIP